jgi:hypothetical protein
LGETPVLVFDNPIEPIPKRYFIGQADNQRSVCRVFYIPFDLNFDRSEAEVVYVVPIFPVKGTIAQFPWGIYRVRDVRRILEFFILSTRNIEVDYLVRGETDFILGENRLGYNMNL